MDEGEVEDDPPSNWAYGEEAADSKAGVLADVDALLNEDSQSCNQTWTNPGLIPVPDEMIAGIPL